MQVAHDLVPSRIKTVLDLRHWINQPRRKFQEGTSGEGQINSSRHLASYLPNAHRALSSYVKLRTRSLNTHQWPNLSRCAGVGTDQLTAFVPTIVRPSEPNVTQVWFLDVCVMEWKYCPHHAIVVLERSTDSQVSFRIMTLEGI
jgi:hypothetical protein